MNVLLGITGSIAAYKAASIARLLVKAGHNVKVVMSAAAKEFITPLTMATVSKNPILVEFFDPENGAWNSHISLAEWADVYIIAPATANTIAKMAAGIADNLLLTTYLSARCSVAVAPAMDCDMYAHPTTQSNLALLRHNGVTIIEPAEGELASGLTGKGRMAEPEIIVQEVERIVADENQKKKSLSGRAFIVTAGATVEPIDPVRYISNRSTGKMGYAVAEQLARRGARVTLVSGPTVLATPRGVERIDVGSADEMYEAFAKRFEQSDGAVMCAAVADYTPARVSDTKIKKGDGDLTLSLRRTRDIAAWAGSNKGDRVLAGFALETDNEQQNAEHKLAAKNLDFIVLNSLRDSGAGFAGDTNRVTIIDRNGAERFELESKQRVAERIAERIERIIDRKGGDEDA